MEDDEITAGTEVFNLEGAGGTVGLARTVNEKGNADLAMLMGLGVVGASYTNKSKSTLAETTPIAKLIEEYGARRGAEGLAVQDDRRPGRRPGRPTRGSLSVGGGSSPGGPDHLFPMQLAQAVGIDPKEVATSSYDGGGDLLPALLGDKIDFGTSGRRRVRGPDRRTASCGCWPSAATSASRASTPRP